MNANEAKALLNPHLSVHPILARLTGSVSAAAVVSQAIYWTDCIGDTGGWFHSTGVQWERATALSRDKQETARARLRGLGFLHEEKRGAPPVLYYRVDFDAIAEAIGRYAGNRVPKNDMTQDDMRKTTE